MSKTYDELCDISDDILSALAKHELYGAEAMVVVQLTCAAVIKELVDPGDHQQCCRMLGEAIMKTIPTLELDPEPDPQYETPPASPAEPEPA